MSSSACGGGEGSNAVGDAAEGTADVATDRAAVGTTVNDEAEDGVGPGPAIAVTGSAWAVLGGAGWPTDEPGVGDRPAWVPASVRLLVRSASVMC